MATAWGKSWGDSWGDAWTPPPPPPVQIDEGWWAYVNTVLIEWFAYNPTSQILLVRLQDKTEQSYSGVPFQIANRLWTTKNPDLYFTATIVSTYPRVYAS